MEFEVEPPRISRPDDLSVNRTGKQDHRDKRIPVSQQSNGTKPKSSLTNIQIRQTIHQSFHRKEKTRNASFLAEPIQPGLLIGLPVFGGGAESPRHAEKVGESGIGFSSGFLRSYSNRASESFHGGCPKVVSSEQVALIYSTTIRPTLSWSTGLMRQSAGLVVHLIGQFPNRENQHQ